jgi:hypothetical protein
MTSAFLLTWWNKFFSPVQHPIKNYDNFRKLKIYINFKTTRLLCKFSKTQNLRQFRKFKTNKNFHKISKIQNLLQIFIKFYSKFTLNFKTTKFRELNIHAKYQKAQKMQTHQNQTNSLLIPAWTQHLLSFTNRHFLFKIQIMMVRLLAAFPEIQWFLVCSSEILLVYSWSFICFYSGNLRAWSFVNIKSVFVLFSLDACTM